MKGRLASRQISFNHGCRGVVPRFNRLSRRAGFYLLPSYFFLGLPSLVSAPRAGAPGAARAALVELFLLPGDSFPEKSLAAPGKLRFIAGGFARAHGVRTYEPRQGRNAATAVCSASAVVSLAFPGRALRSGHGVSRLIFSSAKQVLIFNQNGLPSLGPQIPATAL